MDRQEQLEEGYQELPELDVEIEEEDEGEEGISVIPERQGMPMQTKLFLLAALVVFVGVAFYLFSGGEEPVASIPVGESELSVETTPPPKAETPKAEPTVPPPAPVEKAVPKPEPKAEPEPEAKPEPKPEPKPTVVRESADSGAIEQLNARLESQNQRLQALETRLNENMAALQAAVKELKERPVGKKEETVTTDSGPVTPFRLVSLDVWGNQFSAAVEYRGQVQLLGLGDSLMGWRVQDINYAEGKVTFRRADGAVSNQFIVK